MDMGRYPSSCPSPIGRRDALTTARASPLSHWERVGVRGNALRVEHRFPVPVLDAVNCRLDRRPVK